MLNICVIRNTLKILDNTYKSLFTRLSDEYPGNESI